jgi:hypothetical protein
VRHAPGVLAEGGPLVVNVLLWCLFGLIAGVVAKLSALLPTG